MMLSNSPQANEVHVLRWDTHGEVVYRRSPEPPFQIQEVWSMKVDETLQNSVQHVPKRTTDEAVRDHEETISPDLTPTQHRDEEISYICSDCGKCVIGYSRFIEHRGKHHGKRFKCKQCKLTFRHETYLSRHIATHTVLTPFRCTECHLCFGKNADLLLHQRVHLGEKPYQCAECEQCFSQVSELAVHEMIHDDKASEMDKNIPCQPNFQKWQKGHGMKQHYQCTSCVQSYSNVGHLRRHERSHKVQKPIECPKHKETFRIEKELAEA